MRFQNKVAIVTGGGSGIGAAYVRGFAAAGAAVVVADINVPAAEGLAAALRREGAQVAACALDVTDPASTVAMARFTRETFGGIDILVNNAALYAVLHRKGWDQFDPEEFDRVMAVNVKGVWLCCKAAVPYMKERGKGKIINIGSASIFTAGIGLVHYVASKAAVVGLTRTIARELGDCNICANTVMPGLTDSGNNRPTTAPGQYDSQAARGAIRRVEQPEDLVGTVLFLASDQADFVTGQSICVDGGRNFQ